MRSMDRFIGAIAAIVLVLWGGCAKPKIFISTGTIVGLEASPGSISTTPQAPSLTFGYKRAELALIPIDAERQGSLSPVTSPSTTDSESTFSDGREDAYSVLAVFKMAVNWFGPAKIEQFVATGMAAQQLGKKESRFPLKLATVQEANDALARQIQKVRQDIDQTCWNALDKWRKSNHPSISEEDFLNSAQCEAMRADSVKANNTSCPALDKFRPVQ